MKITETSHCIVGIRDFSMGKGLPKCYRTASEHQDIGDAIAAATNLLLKGEKEVHVDYSVTMTLTGKK